MLELQKPNQFSENPGEKWDSCFMCGPLKLTAIVYFDSGAHEPTVPAGIVAGETLTGAGSVGPPVVAASGDTGVVESVDLTSGSWTGADASGVIVLTSPVGYDSESLNIFADNENLTGAGGVTIAKVNGKPGVNSYGRMYPDGNLIEYHGRKYCREHFAFKFSHDWEDEVKVDTSSENERGT